MTVNDLFTIENIEKYLKERKELFTKEYSSNLWYVLQKLINCLPDTKEITPAIISETLQKDKKLSRSTLKVQLSQVKCFLAFFLGKYDPLCESLEQYRELLKAPKKEPRKVDLKTIKKMQKNLPTNYKFLLFVGSKIGSRRKALTDLNFDSLEKITLKEADQYLDPQAVDLLIRIYGENSIIYVVTRYEKLGGDEALKEISVPILPIDIETLEEFLQKRKDKEKYFLKKHKKGFTDKKGDFLFWNKYGNRLSPNAVSVQINARAKKLGIDFQIHDLRRYAIQYWYSMGFRKEDIKKLSGHESNAIDRYMYVEQKSVWSELVIRSLQNEKGEYKK